MSKFFKRFSALMLVCILCISSSVVAFAATEEENIAPIDTTSSVGQLLYSKTKTLSTGSGSISITTSEGNWDADFSVTVTGNSSGSYHVTMTDANGTSHDMGTISGGGAGTYCNMTYAKAGTYTFYITQVTGSNTSVLAVANIYD